jgi:hypothetical protein
MEPYSLLPCSKDPANWPIVHIMKINSVHAPSSWYFLTIYIYIIFTPLPTSSKHFLACNFTHRNPVHTGKQTNGECKRV